MTSQGELSGIEPADVLMRAVREALAGAARVSRAAAQRKGLVPYRLLVPRLDLRLHWAARRIESESWLFGLITGDESRHDADIRLTLAIELDVDEPLRPGIPGRASLFGFEGVTSLAAGGFDWTLVDGSTVAVRPAPHGDCILRSEDGIEYRLTDSDTRGRPIDSAWMATMARSLARCAAREPKGIELREPRARARAVTTNPLRSLLDRAIRWVRDAEAVVESLADEEHRVDDLFDGRPPLRYVLAGAAAKILVQLDGQGRLADESADDDNWMQVDVLLEAGPGTARMFPRLPDILSGESPMLERFLEPLRSPDFARSLRCGAVRVAALDSDLAAINFVAGLEPGNVVIARANASRDGGRDIDVVLVEGTAGGAPLTLLMTVVYEVSGYPDVEVRSARLRDVLAYRSGAMPAWQAGTVDDLDLRRWLRRICRTLDVAGRGFREGFVT